MVSVPEAAAGLVSAAREDLGWQAIFCSEAALVTYRNGQMSGRYGVWWDASGRPRTWIPYLPATARAERALAEALDGAGPEGDRACVVKWRPAAAGVEVEIHTGPDAEEWASPDGRWQRVFERARPAT